MPRGSIVPKPISPLWISFLPKPAIIDASHFPVGQDIDYESMAEVERLAALRDTAQRFLLGFHWTPPIAELILAFGVAPIIGLFLARFEHGIEGDGNSDTELWVVVGDLPAAYFVVDEAPNPAEALEAYCELMEDWADKVIAGDDLSASYPVAAEPTMEHAHMLKSRLEFIREEMISLA